MSFASSDYLKRLANAQHSDYINSYSQFQEVMQTQTIFAQSFCISKQQFFEQPVTQLTNDGAHYTRVPLAARGTATCSMVQTCLIIWQIEISADTLAIQVNAIAQDGTMVGNVRYKQISNYNAINTGVWDTPQLVTMESVATAATQQPYNLDEHIKFWLGFSTACRPFNQIAICKDSQKLWDTSIYAREPAIISSNSLTDQCTSNSVTVSPLESIVEGKRHCGIFIDIPVNNVIVAGTYNYLIPYDIEFNGVINLKLTEPYLQQLSCIDQKLCVIVNIIMDVKLLVRFKSSMVKQVQSSRQFISSLYNDSIKETGYNLLEKQSSSSSL
ncbi:MAG: hypothetical protein EZS28_035167 [Streblomastix strix]|uniref:Uncharacterized protein n=1 Tax=Streblomastix strix TaxID=222440 RepID=A0A5J4UI99_9EUKA|nr:MAG: hypothetical protein EZS28_035167 [Streblomastix strix]